MSPEKISSSRNDVRLILRSRLFRSHTKARGFISKHRAKLLFLADRASEDAPKKIQTVKIKKRGDCRENCQSRVEYEYGNGSLITEQKFLQVTIPQFSLLRFLRFVGSPRSNISRLVPFFSFFIFFFHFRSAARNSNSLYSRRIKSESSIFRTDEQRIRTSKPRINTV